MKGTLPLGTVIVGCGNIARSYVRDLGPYADIALLGFHDIDLKRAKAFTDEFGGRVYLSLDDVLADPRVDLVVNLTIHEAHEAVTTRCLEGGKHVHTEKPLALSHEGACRLLALAESRGLRLSCAPITWMGEPQQAAARELRRGTIGRVRLVYAEINHGRIETWHPNPAPFYDVGVVWDVGIYPLTLVTAFFGPVIAVEANQRCLMPERRTSDGTVFQVKRPEFVTAIVDFASGVVMRLSCNFYTNGSKQGSSVEFHGEKGTIHLGSSFMFNAAVESGTVGTALKPVALPRPRFEGIEFGRGIEDLAAALKDGVDHRASARHAAHVIEVMQAIDAAADMGNRVEVRSTFDLPQPMPWALDEREPVEEPIREMLLRMTSLRGVAAPTP